MLGSPDHSRRAVGFPIRLLQDCLAARLSGTLAEVDAVVRAAEQAPSREAACAHVCLNIELPGALR